MRAPADATRAQNISNDTVIPLSVVDGPSQRLCVAALYFALAAWRLYDHWQVSNELDSTWLFLKWLAIDGLFLFAIPGLRIPWFEWAFSTTLTAWLVHAVANCLLMYHIPIPVITWLGGLLKFAYDRELSISEHLVKPASIIHNSSLILGKQIIQIMPEGSVILNPEKEAFCVDGHTPSVDLPIRINQTAPILIELLRWDLDTSENETITINAKRAKQLKRQADKHHLKSDTASPRTLHYPVSKRGLYQLLRVVDESKLEVRRKSAETLVVACPGAVLSANSRDKCTGDLSDVSLNVTGVAPFKVKYSKKINKQQASSNVQAIQPSGLDSPLYHGQVSNILVDPRKPNLEWTRSTTITVSINESLNLNGTWSYAIEGVEDGCGNVVAYPTDDGQRQIMAAGQHQRIVVHNRPQVFLHGCDAQTFLEVAKEDSVTLPVKFRPSGHLSRKDWPLTLIYSFVPESSDGDPSTETRVHELFNEWSLPRINKAGKYSVESIKSQFCPGEIIEPSSCLLSNPAEPDLEIKANDLFDKCAGSPIGFSVDLDLTGTPPFHVRYKVSHHGVQDLKVVKYDSLRGHLELKPSEAGFYKYEFYEIEDKVYGWVSLRHKDIILTQNVRPPASAVFVPGAGTLKACLDQPVSIDVKLLGESPWDLEYELVHGSKRKRFSIHSEKEIYSITTPNLSDGGQHSLVLTSVRDKSKCRRSVRQELAIDVRPEQPRASFGDIEGTRSVLALEGKTINLPLRLKGVPPWNVEIKSSNDPGSEPITVHLRDANAAVPVSQPGTYEIIKVEDTCPGIVDPGANKFTVSCVERPTLSVQDPTVSTHGKQYRKPALCINDEDALGLTLTGNAPYHVKYQQKSQPLKGAAAVSNKEFLAAMGSASIRMDTSQAGDYSYTFTELSDDRYRHDRKHFNPITVHQKVHALPSARFGTPGKTFGYCKDDTDSTDQIPITLEGDPPFAVDIGITHHGTSRPEIVRLSNIPSNSYSWLLARRGLDLGTHSVTIRKVKDGKGCERIVDDDPSSVRIMVSNPPTIIPLESRTDYCVGEHVSYSLSGKPPFDVFYKFQGHERKARARSTDFKRIAEKPGEFTITGVSDNASGKCKASKDITKVIHPMPSVKVSKGKTSIADIHEGGEVEILFEFTGTPPFEFT